MRADGQNVRELVDRGAAEDVDQNRIISHIIPSHPLLQIVTVISHPTHPHTKMEHINALNNLVRRR